ncbi:hypothetical protein M406DRAFT_79659 [Cryphonectria parasitica EP155]|uniref:Inclusion body clearance protein IML2 n=1 Tax=Cryphonectria parasitica (strain ATCC 38755 / EP155) TaxID=660469 RepID=A0A9P5CQ69_CRYP1|nr:uncharacterized protein M406DRAFT_79659 [Cryphonectria parasitica EP155]KAF3767209.1 hypothetical protein M406DRAFT_79659 [Cryphonectria parasitica EP155]
MRSWFKSSGSGSSKPGSILSSSRNTSTNQVADARDVEISDLHDAMEATSRILNDDIQGAEAQLRARQDSSAFHQLGLGIAVFMRSILGFEKDIMTEASARLAECESRAWSEMKKAQKQADGGGGGGWFRGGASGGGTSVSAKGCEMYPPGTEYQLVNAEAQIMGAIVSVMHESLTEGIKGFYKLRKAFIALDAIMETEAKILAAQQGNGAAKGPNAPPTLDQGAKDLNGLTLDTPVASSVPSTRPDTPAAQEQSGSPLPSPPRTTLRANAGPDSSLFTNPVDIFVHSGANMCFGTLLLIISMVPPAFSRLLYIIGFKGDRNRGVQMLWQSTKFSNVNAGVAGLMLLSYYNGLLAFTDILPSEADTAELAEEDEIVGYPKEQCTALLERMCAQYPDSRIWKVEEARVLANARKLPEAIEVLKANGDSKMRQVTALNEFELSVNALFMMDWQTMKEGFLRCIELNDWSHSLYYYFVGCAELEMYRDAEKSTLETEAKRHKKTAEEYFRKSPAAAGRKKFLARQMPLEMFAQRKVAKWESRAKEWGLDLADAAGVSPGQEMTYLWTGSKRMTDDALENALGCLAWERCTAGKENIEKLKAIPDEAAIKAVAEAALLSNLGRYAEAREKVEPVSKQDRALFRGEFRDDWPAPCAHYELGVLAWKEGCDSKCWPQEADEQQIETFRRDRIKECEEYLEHVKTWEAFVLDARVGMKVQSGIDTIAWLKGKKGWA